MLSGEKFQKSLIIFPRNWELFYSSLKFVVSDLASDQNTLRAGAPPSSLLLVLTTFATSSIEHDDYRVEREDWRWRGNCRLQAARMEEDNTRTGGGGWTRRLIRTEGKHWSCSSGCWSSNVVIQMRLQQYQLSPPASNIL